MNSLPFSIVDEVSALIAQDWFTERGEENYGGDLVEKYYDGFVFPRNWRLLSVVTLRTDKTIWKHPGVPPLVRMPIRNFIRTVCYFGVHFNAISQAWFSRGYPACNGLTPHYRRSVFLITNARFEKHNSRSRRAW